MPGKSRHKRKKYPIQSKKGKDTLNHPTIPAQQPVVAQTRGPAISPNVSVRSAKAPAQMVTPAAGQYSNATTELRNIGILAGIMLIILIVLSLAHLPW